MKATVYAFFSVLIYPNTFKGVLVLFEDQKTLYGDCHIDGIKKAMEDFWKIIGEIRKELGDKSYYLDEYLSIILNSIGSANMY